MSVLLKIGKCITKSILMLEIVGQYALTMDVIPSDNMAVIYSDNMDVISSDNMDVISSGSNESSKKRTFEQSQLPSVEGQLTKILKTTEFTLQEYLTLSNDCDDNLFSVLPNDVRYIINRYMMSPYIFKTNFKNFYNSNPGQIALTVKSMLTDNQHSYSGGICRWFAMAHQWNTITFKSWNLSGNKLGVAGFKILAKVLEKNTTITGLNLSDTDLCSETCHDLAGVLRINTSIIDLNISGNRHSHEGLSCLLMVLKDENKTLKHLNMGHNITQTYNNSNNIYYLIDSVFNSNKTLTSLHLDGFKLSNKCIKNLTGIITKNKTLSKLSLIGCDIDNYIQPILTVLKNNTTLKELILFKKAIQVVNAAEDDSEGEYLVDEEATYTPNQENALIKAFREAHEDRVEFYG